VGLGTIPALVGLPLRDTLEQIEGNPRLVGGALIATGLILAIGSRWSAGSRRLETGRWTDAIAVGLAQALALVPGVSRSGSTITAGLMRGFDREEAARFSFLLAIPAIAGGGLLSLLEVANTSIAMGPVLVGLFTAAVSGYFAITALIRLLVSRGLGPFVTYCVVVGTAAVVFL
jgi:undecaprenyl-diphosphatase